MSAIRQGPGLIGTPSFATPERHGATTPSERLPAASPRPLPERASARADPHLLRPLECRLSRATTVAAVYDLARGTARRRAGVRCALIVSVDSERLSLPVTGGPLTSAARRQVAEHLTHQRSALSAHELRIINASDNATADPIEHIVTARLGLPHVAVGRIKLDRSTVALLVTSHLTSPTAGDRIAAAEIAALITPALQRTLDNIW